MPVLNSKFNSYEAFALANLPQILGEDMANAIHKKAYIFSSIILENQQGKLIVRRLPTQAQFSTVNSIIADDLDGDGVKDLLIAGNRFDVEVETTPADVSPGYFLKRLGGLEFRAIPPVESGLFIPYNVKDVKQTTVGAQKALLIGSNDDSLRIVKTNWVN